MKLKRICYLLLLILLPVSNAFNVLVASPFTIKSLHGLVSKIAIGLADAGHNVTYVTPFPISKEHKNINTLLFPQVLQFLDSFKPFELKSQSNFSKALSGIYPKFAKVFWSDERAMSLWKRRKEFDMFVAMSYASELTFPFLMDSPATFVQICTPGVESVSLSREGNWLAPSVVPSILLNYDEYMTFWERAINLPSSISYYYLAKYISDSSFLLLKDYFPEFDNSINYYDQVALTLINGHFAIDGPVPLLPSQIEIGTINAKKAEPLDKELEEFFQGSGDAGVIYFSLGSIANSTDIPREAKNVFLEAFRKVSQRILWKYEGTDLDAPPNVMIRKWMPQQDILGHPKTKVFISHCGNLGTQEAKYHGVPVLAVPIAFDQPRNAARMARKGYAIVINWEDLSVEKVLDALNTLITDSSYRDRLQSVARILKDQKDTPVERAVWWMEYVVRHKGAPHLQYAGRRLSLFQYIMLDVILFWTSVICLFIALIVYLIKVTCWRLVSKKTSKLKRKNE